jgi:EXLDI family protein
MPNKTIYVSDDDQALFKRAQELAGGSLSSAITTALRRYVEAQEGLEEGYDEITVRVGPGAGRKQRFVGVQLGEWGRSNGKQVEIFRVYRSRNGKYVVHVERSRDVVHLGPDGTPAGWRAYLSSKQSWGSTTGEKTLHVVDSVAELRELIPPELFELIEGVLQQAPIEDLDI